MKETKMITMQETGKTLDDFEPKDVFAWFEKITEIPRGSGGEKAISDFLMKYAKDNGCEVEQDKIFNLVIRKPASHKEYENKPAIMLQAHLDIVWKPAEAFKGDKNPIKLLVKELPEDSRRGEGKYWLMSDNTTLGADDGIGLAYCMALIAPKDPLIKHPPLEIVFTTQEEAGLIGAKEYDVKWLKSNTFINIDSETESVLTTSCCGGMRFNVELPVNMIKASSIDDYTKYKAFIISVSGLAGGHSGVEIDKERGNSNRLLGRILNDVVHKLNVDKETRNESANCYLAAIKGGDAPNTIPTSTEATVFLKDSDADKVKGYLSEWQSIFTNELKFFDGSTLCHATGKNYEVKVKIEDGAIPEMLYDDATFKKVLTVMTLMPHGVATRDINQEIPETSNNFAMISIHEEGKHLIFNTNIRSSIATKKEFIKSQVQKIADVIGANVSQSGTYPAWPYQANSPIREVFKTVHKTIYEKDVKLEGIHAGLECGVFSSNFAKDGRENVDMIAFGPTIIDEHTETERLHIASVGRTWNLLKEVLRILAET